MYPSTKFDLIWQTSEKFEKISIKMEISTWSSTSVPNFSQFEEFHSRDQVCPKNMNKNNFEKRNIKI